MTTATSRTGAPPQGSGTIRRRIVVAIAATAVGTLVLAMVTAVVLTRLDAEDRAVRSVSDQAPVVAQEIVEGLRRASFGSESERQQTLRQTLSAIRGVLGGAQVDTYIVNGRSTITDDTIRVPLTEAELLSAVPDAPPVTLVRDDVAYGIASVDLLQNVSLVVVVSEDATTDLGPAAGRFLLAGVLAVGIASLAAWRLGRRISEPVDPVRTTTAELAGGDLTARVDVDPSWPRELVAMANSVNDLAATLERQQGLEQQFLMSVSHDLRTPLTAIRGFAEALSDGTAAADPEIAARSAEIIVAQSARLERLVKDLLELARLDARQFSLERRPTDLGQLVQHAAGGFAPAAVDAGLELDVAIAPGAAMVAGVDPDRVAQILANLIENATKFAGARIHVGVERTNAGIELSVHDDGPGIADVDLPHVFERLYVAKRDPVRQEVGSGLGLAIVAELAGSMDGQATARRSDLGGACLAVSFPSID